LSRYIKAALASTFFVLFVCIGCGVGFRPSVKVSSMATGISVQYPGDAGIENDPNVIFTDMFEASSVADVTSRYEAVGNASAMSLTGNVPAGSSGSHSLQLTANGNGVQSPSLYKLIQPGGNDQWYVRYYIHYASTQLPHHSGVWFGGYSPISYWPDPQAGAKPVGDDRFFTGIEPNGLSDESWMNYTYWKDMHPDGGGAYWGNILNNDAGLKLERNRWYCFEMMIKLNNPVSESNGELAVWIDGRKVIHMGPGFPNGNWSGGLFQPDPNGSPFSGFQWRTVSALNLNHFWVQNYNSSTTQTVVSFDHLVLSKSYVGCLK
jgi:hypothetical protein